MRKIMMTMAALGLSSGVAWGQSASQEIRLSATVGSYCNFNSSSLVLLSADASTIISGNRIPGTTNTPLPIPMEGALALLIARQTQRSACRVRPVASETLLPQAYRPSRILKALS